ncbi:hypothetical protein B4Q13_25205, partial [Lacticaseibacillus rhamnosus]
SFDMSNGELAWTYSTGGYAYSAPTVASTKHSPPTVYIGSFDGNIYALDAKTGSPVRSFGTDGIVDLKAGAGFGNRQPLDLRVDLADAHAIGWSREWAPCRACLELLALLCQLLDVCEDVIAPPVSCLVAQRPFDNDRFERREVRFPGYLSHTGLLLRGIGMRPGEYAAL